MPNKNKKGINMSNKQNTSEYVKQNFTCLTVVPRNRFVLHLTCFPMWRKKHTKRELTNPHFHRI